MTFATLRVPAHKEINKYCGCVYIWWQINEFIYEWKMWTLICALNTPMRIKVVAYQMIVFLFSFNLSFFFFVEKSSSPYEFNPHRRWAQFSSSRANFIVLCQRRQCSTTNNCFFLLRRDAPLDVLYCCFVVLSRDGNVFDIEKYWLSF